MTVDPQQRNLVHVHSQLVWISFLGSQVLFVALLLSGIVPAGRTQPAELVAVFTGVAVAAGIAGHVLWRQARAPVDRVLREPANPSAMLPRYIVAWALDETIAILGLVLGLLGFPPGAWSGFTIAAFLLTLMHRPA